MNAQGYYEELTGETVITAESDALRAWFNGLNLEALPVNETISEDFFKHTVSVFRGEKVFYLFTKSPQQKIYRRSMPTAHARGNVDDLLAGLERFIKQMEAKQERHTAQKEAKKNARQSFVNPYKVGDFLYSSWGYDQTNREFYQILEVRPLALKIREVHQHRTADGFMCGNASPKKDAFMEKEPERWVTIQVNGNGYHSVPSPIHGNLYPYEGKPVYYSEYA